MANEALEVLEFLGDTSPYLHLMPGKATLNLRKILTPLLYREMLGAVKKTARARVARKPGVSLLLGTGRKKINIEVTRLKNDSAGEIRYRILLEEVSPRSGKSAKAEHKPKAQQTEEPEAARLKQELAATKGSFSAILAEQDQGHQATLKELGASHEEAQTIAARLEVMNAELEASQAELEETAEELRVALAASERHGQESEGRVRALLESAGQGIVAVERGGRIGLVNGTAEKMFGYGREELLGQPVEMLLPHNFRRAHRRHRREFFAHPRTRPMGQGLDLFARRKDGTTFPVEVSLSHIEPESDTVAAAFISDITERKRAEESLRESEARFRHVADNAPVLIWMSGPDKRCTWFNKPWLELTGRSMEQELGDGWAEGVHPDDLDRCLRTYVEAFDARKPFTMDYRLRRADGQYRWVLDTGIPQFTGVEFTGYLGSCIDITERKRAEEARRESEERFRIAAQCGNDLIYEWNLESNVLEWWGDIEACLGYRPGTLEVFEKVMHPEDRDTVMGTVQRHLENGGLFAQEYRVRAKDETYHSWWDRGMALRDAQSKPYKWIGACTDITERKVAEQELREEHAFNAALLDTVRALVVVLDREGRIVRFNKACQEITGYSFEEVQGRRVWELLLVPEEAAAVRRVFRKAKAGQVPVQFENHWVTKNGERRLISWSNTALLDSSGTMSFGIGTGLDITEQRRLEETIRQSRNDLRKLTARLISAQEGAYRHLARELHDVFSQKLAILGMHVSELERKFLAAGMPMEEGLKPIGEEISGLASEIHGISRRLHPVILDDLGLAVALKNECLAFSREHGIKVEFHAESLPLSLSNDVALCLYRIAQEGLNNIQKHAETGQARVTLVGHPGEVVLSIEDFGKGFQPEEVRGKGGLGLVSMEERVRLVGGKLTIQSRPGDGTTIQIRVPLKRPGRRRGKQ